MSRISLDKLRAHVYLELDILLCLCPCPISCPVSVSLLHSFLVFVVSIFTRNNHPKICSCAGDSRSVRALSRPHSFGASHLRQTHTSKTGKGKRSEFNITMNVHTKMEKLVFFHRLENGKFLTVLRSRFSSHRFILVSR